MTFVQRNPVLLAAFAFMAGISAAHLEWRPCGWMLLSIAGAALAAIFLSVRSRKSAFATALLSAVALGVLDAQVESQAHHDQPSLSAHATGLLYTFTGTVIRSGTLRTNAAGTIQSIDVAVESVERYGTTEKIPSGIRLAVIDSGGAPLPYGAQVRFDAQLHEAQLFRDPGVWNRRAWLATQGITALASVHREKIEVLPGFGGTRFGFIRDAARKSLLQHLHRLGNLESHYRWISLDSEDIALLEAMMLGERSELDYSDKLDFQRTGSFHLLVVSGMNIAIFAVAIFWAMRRLRFGEWGASLLTAMFAISYAALTDLGAPVMRAVLMALLFLVARLFYRTGASLNAIGTGALVILAWKPSALFEASFQMTFTLVNLTSAKYSTGLRQLWTLNRDFALPREVVQFRLDLRMIIRRLQRVIGSFRASHSFMVLPLRLGLACTSLLTLSFIMQCVMALPTALYFHRVAVTALIANSVVVPLMEALMPLVILSLIASYASVWIAMAPAALTALALHGISKTISFLGSARFADVRAADPSGMAITACCVAFLFAWYACQRRSRWGMVCGISAMTLSAALIALPQTTPRSDALEITAIDVGQGDSLLVITPEGKSLLIDSGGPSGAAALSGSAADIFDYGEDVVSPYLWSRGIDRLDAVAISHGHSDHMQGMPAGIRNFQPRELWVGLVPDSPLYERVLAAAKDSRTKIVEHRENDQFAFGGTDIAVLAPARDAAPSPQAMNNDSMSLYIRFGKAAALLSGDAEHSAEARIAAHMPHAQLLKVDHHGSMTSTDPQLLSVVQPEYAVISAGAHNRFGHPRREVLERLADAHVRTLRTDTTGAISFLLAPDGSTKVRVASPHPALQR